MEVTNTKSVINSYWFLASIRASTEVSVILDTNLKYLAVSQGFCKLLNKKRYELEGNTILELYPEFVKLKNYENIKLALQGNEFIDTVPAITGEMFVIHYRPLLHNGEVQGVHTESRRVEMSALGVDIC